MSDERVIIGAIIALAVLLVSGIIFNGVMVVKGKQAFLRNQHGMDVGYWEAVTVDILVTDGAIELKKGE